MVEVYNTTKDIYGDPKPGFSIVKMSKYYYISFIFPVTYNHPNMLWRIPIKELNLDDFRPCSEAMDEKLLRYLDTRYPDRHCNIMDLVDEIYYGK